MELPFREEAPAADVPDKARVMEALWELTADEDFDPEAWSTWDLAVLDKAVRMIREGRDGR